MNELEKIFKTCCDVVGISPDVAKIKNKERDYVRCRYLYCYFAKNKGYSLAQIGGTIDRDHATVLHGYRKIVKFLSINDSITTYYIKLIDIKLNTIATKESIFKELSNDYLVNLQQMIEILNLDKTDSNNNYIKPKPIEKPIEKTVYKYCYDVDLLSRFELLRLKRKINAKLK